MEGSGGFISGNLYTRLIVESASIRERRKAGLALDLPLAHHHLPVAE